MKTLPSTHLPVKIGCDYLRDSDFNPVKRTLKSAQYMADRIAAKQQPIGKWKGFVFDAGTHYRISIGAKC